MPLYEYQCRKCKHRFERIQKFSDPILRKCPECGAGLELLISASAVQFKGTGWYVTDYPKKGTARPSESGESAKESGADKTESKPKTESKSESRSESKKHHERKK